MASALLLIGVLCILGANGFASAGKARLKREPNSPEPVDCLLTTWSNWGPCSPCSEERYRSRSILRFGQFGGKPCIESLNDKEPCKTRTPCLDETGQCKDQEFECENGYCIKGRLVCNTEDECGDFSDEDNCDETKRPPCGNRDIDVSELGRTAGQGVNVLGMKPAQKPFYNEFYNGLCDRVRDGNTATYYRKPWNVAVLSYETRGDKKISSELYSNQASTVQNIVKTQSHSVDASLSLKLKSASFPANLKTGINFSKSTSLSDFLQKTKGKNYEYLHVKSSIQLGTFLMRKRGLRLSEAFLEDLKMLPSSYEKGEYFAFLETYGTHYSQRGIIGGKYELIYVLDNRTMTSKRITTKDVNECLGFDLNLGVDLPSTDLKFNVNSKKCKGEKSEKKSTNNEDGLIHEVVSLIQGGTIATLTNLNELLSSNFNSIGVERYIKWANTLIQAPAVIKQEMAPISDLIPTNIPDSRSKKVNLDRAVEDYVAEYNVCKCKPCLHGGTVMLIDGKCECACTPYYKGDACETPASNETPADTAVHGSWSCWSSWSACQQGQRRRTRKCDNPAPGYRGRSCPGANIEPGYC
ncbi:complement component C9-like isoform X2 [Thamnophis elegans]|uniref:complement component C9-like isoform X2 n=1 Tax=Thamnophis elegans TaxID=35005 RepID=UPI0013764C3C|nr:complement component C9-like isoform X2 [Thamnophis elegans]